MKKYFNIAFVALMAIIVAACGKEDPFPPTDGSEVGTLNVKKMILKIENEENIVRSSVNVGSFIVDICKGDEVVDSYVYSEMPEVITLPVGQYTVKVRSGELQPVAWEAPYFEGSQDFEVKKKEITEVSTVVCKLANVRVSIIFDDSIKNLMSDDSKVNVVMGDGASIDFAKNETRSAYFAYVEGSNTLVATFSGTIQGGQYEEFKAYTDVKPGNHYKITYSLHNGELPDPSGNIVFSGVNVDASVTETDLTINIDPDDEILPDDERPGEDGGDNPPTPPTPGSGPSIVVPDDSDIVLDSVMDIVNGATYKLVITSETGFTVFKVDIISPYLTEDFLSPLSMSTHLDLVNPGQYGDALSGLGLPINVGGKTSETFDISSLVPLLDADPESDVHEFVLTVGDASGTVTKSLKFRNLK